MRIGTRQIGPDQPPYIIAELGVNHDGSVERALELVDAAAGAGADAIKLQFFKADMLMSKASRLAAYQEEAGERDPVEMLGRLELSIEQLRPIVDRAHARGLHAIVTVFSVELVEQAARLPWDAYKSASPDIIHRPLLEALSATGKPLIVSTGASTLDEVVRAVRWLDGVRSRLAALQCVSAYPTPEGRMALGGIEALRRVLGLPIGYSDHTTGVASGALAAYAGACILEKHLTWSKGAPGPDHASSLEPSEFAAYASGARSARQEDACTRDRMETDATTNADREIAKRVLPIEQDVRAVSRQSIVTTRELPTDHRISRSDVTFKRPGTGIPPFRLDEVVGRCVARAVEADAPLVDNDLA